MEEKYVDLALQKTMECLAIDSPTGFAEPAADYCAEQFTKMGYPVRRTNQGGVIIDFGGQNKENGLLLLAHADTLGGIVAEIKDNGRLRLSNLGGVHPENCEGENVRVYSFDHQVYEGTLQFIDPSVHVNKEYSTTLRNWNNMEVVLDYKVKTKEDVEKLGISCGNKVCFETRSRMSGDGYIKSRYLDDKLLVGILLAYGQYLKDHNITLPRATYGHITVYEETSMGGASFVPEKVTEGLALDMGCVGNGLKGNECKVSICVKDTSGPYNGKMVSELVKVAKEKKLDYALDVYPNYGSDVEVLVRSGADIRHGLIGPGVYASHGYERSHRDGVRNTLELLSGYCEK